jgi:tetratricopeptide (TPR) repeat protein
MFTRAYRAYQVAFLAIALLLTSGIALGQNGRLAGRVIDENGEGVKDAVVRVERQSMSGKYEVKTNKRGEYLFGFLPMARYNVFLVINGKTMSQTNGIQPASAGEPTELDFDLGKIQKERTAANSGTMSEERLKSMSPQQRKRYEESLKKRRQEISKNKELNDAFNLGMEAVQARNYAAAITQFEKAATLDDEQIAVWAQLAQAQAKFADTKRGDEAKKIRAGAIASYQKALVLKPDEPGYRNNLALEFIKDGNVDEGQAELEKAATLDPENAGKYYYNLGAVMVNAGNTDGAINAFRKATEIDPDYAPAFYQLGIALMSAAGLDEQGNPKPAEGTIEAFEKYVELAPTGPFAASAKSMAETLKTTVATSYENPDAKKRKRRKK